MGQYLSVYLVGEVSIRIRKDIELTDENVYQALLDNGFKLDLSLYEIYESDSGAYLELKEDVLKEQLVPFMKAFYDYIYDDPGENIQGIFDYIEENETVEWDDLKERIQNTGTMEECCILPYYNPWRGISAEGISLLCSEKIITEGWTRIKFLFTKCLRDHFSEYPLSKALRLDLLC